jgi:O-acetyl-ADP-ribose deacetylase (regulator of RNase III)
MLTRIELIKGDITQVLVDAIVVGANRDLLSGGSVYEAVYRAAGPELVQAVKKIGGCPIGEARITQGFLLPATYVIHTVGPLYGSENGEEDYYLGRCYYKSLELAMQKGLVTIAFPNISTGIFRYPKDEAARIAIESVQKFLEDNPESGIKKITFVAYTDKDYKFLYNEMKEKGLV